MNKLQFRLEDQPSCSLLCALKETAGRRAATASRSRWRRSSEMLCSKCPTRCRRTSSWLGSRPSRTNRYSLFCLKNCQKTRIFQLPSWLGLPNNAEKVLLPKDISTLKRTSDNIKEPLFRFFEREINLGTQLLRDIRRDLEDVLAVCKAERKQGNETRALAAALQKGQVGT